MASFYYSSTVGNGGKNLGATRSGIFSSPSATYNLKNGLLNCLIMTNLSDFPLAKGVGKRGMSD